MTEPSLALFRQACGSAGPLRLAVERPGGPEVVRTAFDRPFALVGREPWADLPLDDPAVSRRHAYLQVIDGRVFCLDLESRTGVHRDGQPLKSGWLEPGRPVRIGPFELRVEGGADAPPGPAADWDPLAPRPADQDPLPAVSLEVLAGTRKGHTGRMNRVLALVGQSAACKVHLTDWGVGRYHAALLRTPLGLWCVDLLGSGGTSVNRTPVRWARLAHGDEVLVGDTLFAIRYDPAPGPAVAPAGDREAEPGPPEGDRLRGELEAARAEAMSLAGRVAELEGAAAELAREHEARDRADAERWRGELDAARTETAALRARVAELEPSAAELTAARAALERAEAAERTRADAEQRWREELGAARAGEARAAAEANGLRGELDEARGQLGREREERGAARAEADALRAELETAREQAAGVPRLREALDEARAEAEGLRAELASARRDLEHARGAAAGEAARLRDEAEALRAEHARAAAEGAALRDRVAELERSAAEALDRGRWESQVQWESERLELRGQLQVEARGREADRRAAAAALDAARAELARAKAEAARGDPDQPGGRAELEAARAEAAALRTRAAELERAAAGAEALRAELAAARGRLDDERAARQAEADRLRREVDALRRDNEAISRLAQGLTAELNRPVPHGAELGPAPPRPGDPARAVPADQVRAEQARAEAVRADLQRQLAETTRQLQEARARAARLEQELRGPQQYVTFKVSPVTFPPDKGGPPRGT